MNSVIYLSSNLKPNGNTYMGYHGWYYDPNEESNKSPRKDHPNNHQCTTFGYRRKNLLTKHKFDDKKLLTENTLLKIKVGIINEGSNSSVQFNELFDKKMPVSVEPIEYFEGGYPIKDELKDNSLVTGLIKLIDYYSKICDKITIITNITYLSKVFNRHLNAWSKRDFKEPDGTPYPDADDWKKLHSILNDLKNCGKIIIIKNIELINAGDELGIRQTTVINHVTEYGTFSQLVEKDKMWNYPIEKPELFIYRKMYYPNEVDFSDEHYYYLANVDTEDKELGRMLPSRTYALVRLNKPEQPIQLLKSITNKIDKTPHLYSIQLPNLYNSTALRCLNTYHDKAVSVLKEENIKLNLGYDESLSYELNPPGLSIKVVEFYQRLFDYYNEITSYFKTGKCRYKLEFLDITDHFYTKSKDKFTLKPEFKVGTSELKFKIESPLKLQIRLALNVDLPDRNTLKRLEKTMIDIHFISWKLSENSIKYLCLVRTTEGDILLDNRFSNLVYQLKK